MIDLSPAIVTVVFVVGILLAVLTGYPISVALGGVGLLIGYVALGPAVFELVYDRVYSLIQTYALAAVPLFVFMGVMLEKSQVTASLYDALYMWFGGLRGGLAISTVLFGTLLAACLGVIAASITMMTVIALGQMLSRGYDKGLASGAICAGGCLGILIPPSIMLVLYGPMAGISVGKLFMAAIFPGLTLSALYCAYILIRSMIQPELAPAISEKGERVALTAKVSKLFVALVPTMVLILAVLGSIFTGVAAPTEAAGVGAMGSIALTVAYRKFSWRILTSAALETVRVVGFVVFIAIFSFAIVGIFIRAGGDVVVRNFILTAPFGRWGAFVIVMALLLVLGMFIDWLGIVFIVVPILSPIVPALGFDTLWFAMMVCVNLQMSFMTPPFAQAIFMCLGSAPKELGLTMSDVVRGILPFVGLVLLGLALCVAFPDIILWLPGRML